MATIVTLHAPRRSPRAAAFLRWLDELGPVLLLAAVLAVVMAAAYVSRPGAAGAPRSFTALSAE